MDDTVPEAVPLARKKPFILFVLLQWPVAGLMALWLFLSLDEVSKLSLPDAPIALYVASIALMAVVTIALVPPVFFRMPLLAKQTAYVGIFISFFIYTAYLQQMEPVWNRTPAGARAAKERAEAVEQEKRARLEQEREAKANPSPKDPDLDNPPSTGRTCESIIPEVIDLSAEQGPKIIEINDAQTQVVWSSGTGYMACRGMAITENGNTIIEYGTDKTPQGRSIITLQY